MPTPTYSIGESMETMDVDYAWSGEVTTIVRAFDIKWTNAESPLEDEILKQLDIQKGAFISRPHPRYPSLLCRRVTFKHRPGASWSQAFAHYTGLGKPTHSGTTGDSGDYPDAPTFAEPTWRTQLRDFDLYRRTGSLTVTYPTDGNATGVGDISGDPVDQAGEPFRHFARQEIITIDTLHDATTGFPDRTFYDPYLFHRSTDVFLGRPAGAVILQSVDIAPRHPGVYTKSFTFLFDEYFHMRQRPVLDVNGQPLLDGTGAGAHATTVFWFQPYEQLSMLDFEELFTAAEWDYINRVSP